MSLKRFNLTYTGMAGQAEFEILRKLNTIFFIQTFNIFAHKSPIVRVEKSENYESALEEIDSLLSKWEDTYEDERVDCGVAWEIVLEKGRSKERRLISGYSAYPTDFDKLEAILVNKLGFK